jgi:hypothetical protein
MFCMLSTKTAVFIKLKFIRSGPFIFGGCVISVFTLWTRKGYDYSHLNNSFKIIPGLNNFQQTDSSKHQPLLRSIKWRKGRKENRSAQVINLFNNFTHHTGTDRTTAFTDRKP